MTTITLRGVRKAYGATQALAGADLDLHSGTIVGIAGPNGAGKSTLTRVLAGEEPADVGTFTIDGADWDPRSQDGYVAVVHQEPQIWPNLTVLDNLLVGREPGGFGYPRAGPREREVLSDLGLAEVAGLRTEQCSLAVRQRTEIARAMVRDARCYIFDEPNSALTEDESEALFAFMHHLAASDHLVMLISHRLGELVAHCDEVVIVRGGVVAARLAGAELDEEAVAAELVVGHPTQGGADERKLMAKAHAAPRTVELADWRSCEGMFDVADLKLRSGEVAAFVGVEGSGARELVASFAGFHETEGKARLDGQDLDMASASSFLSADRRGILFDNLTVGDNLVVRLGRPRIASPRLGMLREQTMAATGQEAVDRFGVKTAGIAQPVIALSGGNQQKVAIAAALVSEPTMLVIEEPTRGVDVGSKRGIYATLQDAAARGVVVVVYCTEAPEVFDLADRFVVIDRGERVFEGRPSDYLDVTAMAERIAASGHAAPAHRAAATTTKDDS